MKQISPVLCIISFLGVIALFIIQFSSSETGSEETVVQGPSASRASSMSDARIIYVNTDTLWQKYELYGKYLEDLVKEKQVLEKQYETRMRRFEADVKKFQEKAPYMSQQLGEKEQARILGEEKNLLQMQEDMSMQLAESEMSKNNEIREKILAKISEFNSDGRYDFVLGYSVVSPVLYANDSLDVTYELLEELNAEYGAKEEASN
jgi:outer membrane protein